MSVYIKPVPFSIHSSNRRPLFPILSHSYNLKPPRKGKLPNEWPNHNRANTQSNG